MKWRDRLTLDRELPFRDLELAFADWRGPERERRSGLPVFAQRITPFSPSMASREARSRPSPGRLTPIDGCAAA